MPDTELNDLVQRSTDPPPTLDPGIWNPQQSTGFLQKLAQQFGQSNQPPRPWWQEQPNPDQRNITGGVRAQAPTPQPQQVAMATPEPPQATPPQQPPPVTAPEPPPAPGPETAPASIANAPAAKPERLPFQRFVPSTGRPYHQWGKPSPEVRAATLPNSQITRTSLMPADTEAINVIRGAAGQLGRTAAPAVAQPMNYAANLASIIGPFFDFFSNNAFSQAYRARALGGAQQQESALRMQEAEMRMQEQQMNLNRERMMDAVQQGLVAHQSMLDDYQDVFYRLDKGLITPAQAKEELLQLNAENGHNNLDAYLEHNDLKGAYNYLEWEDKRFHDNLKAYTSLYESDKKAGKTVGESTLGKSILGTSGGADDTGIDVSKLPGPDTAPTGTAPVTAPDTTPTEPEATGADDAQIAKDAGLPDADGSGMKFAHEASRTGLYHGMTETAFQKAAGEKAAAAVIQASQDIDSRISKALSGEGGLEDKIAAVKKIDPLIAEDLKDIYQYKKTAKEKGAAKDKFSSWVSQLDPDYDEGKFTNARQYTSEKGNTIGSAIHAGTSLSTNYVQFLNILKQLPEGQSIPKNVLEAALANKLSGDSPYYTLGMQIRQLAQNIAAIQAGGGQIKVTLVEEMLHNLPTTASPRQLRTALQAEMTEVWARMAEYQKNWNAEYHREGWMPGMHPDDVALWSGILRMNPAKQQVPMDKDTPDILKAVNKPEKEWSSHLHDWEKWSPPSMEDIHNAQALIKKYENNPDPKIQEMVQHARDTLLGILNPPWSFNFAPR